MQILPAIDIKDGQVVRLFKGDFNQQTVVNPNVIEQAKTFKDAGINLSRLDWMVLLMVVPLTVI